MSAHPPTRVDRPCSAEYDKKLELALTDWQRFCHGGFAFTAHIEQHRDACCGVVHDQHIVDQADVILQTENALVT